MSITPEEAKAELERRRLAAAGITPEQAAAELARRREGAVPDWVPGFGESKDPQGYTPKDIQAGTNAFGALADKMEALEDPKNLDKYLKDAPARFDAPLSKDRAGSGELDFSDSIMRESGMTFDHDEDQWADYNNVLAEEVDRGGRGQAFGSAAGNSLLLGFGDDVAGLGAMIRGESFAEGKQESRNKRGAFRDEHPITSMAGDIAGFIPAGGGIFKAGQAALKGASSRLPSLASGAASRLTRWGGRMAGLGALGAAENAAYQGTVGASNAEAEIGRDVSLGERASMVGDAAMDPLAWAALPVMSSLYRLGRGAWTGQLTPNDVAARVANEADVPAKMGDVGRAIHDTTQEVFEGGATPASIKSFRFIENALRDARLPDERIAGGIENIRDTLARNPQSTPDLALLLEGEFGKEAPQVVQNIRRFLMKVGQDSPEGSALIRGSVDQSRSETAGDLRNVADGELGSQSRKEASEVVEETLQGYGRAYDSVLDAAPRDGDAADMARQLVLQQPEASTYLLGRARAAGYGDVEQYVNAEPMKALHWLQSEINQLGDPHLSKVALSMRGVLEDTVEGYKGLVGQYAREMQAQRALGKINPQTGKLEPGLGDRLLGDSRREFTAAHIADEYKALPPRAAGYADLSIRDAITDPLRMTRARGQAVGADDLGGDVAGARMARIQNEGVLTTLRDMLGARGEKLDETVRNFVYRRQRDADIDPRTGSNTANKINAQGDGARAFSNTLGRQIETTGGDLGTGLIDAGLLATGNLPVATLARRGPGFLAKVLQPRPKTQIEIAETLLRRARDPAAGAPNPPPPPLQPLPAKIEGGGTGGALPMKYPRPGDPQRPARGDIEGGVDEAGYPVEPPPFPEEVAGGRRSRFIHSEDPNVPDWPGEVPQRPRTLAQFVIESGGIADQGGDVAAVIGGAQGRPGLLANGGKQLDYMIEEAASAGYLPEAGASGRVTQREFLDLLDEDLRGRHRFPPGSEADEWLAYEEWASKAGVKTPYEVYADQRAARKSAIGLDLDDPKSSGSAAGDALGGGALGAVMPIPEDPDDTMAAAAAKRAAAIGIGAAGGSMARGRLPMKGDIRTGGAPGRKAAPDAGEVSNHPALTETQNRIAAKIRAGEDVSGEMGNLQSLIVTISHGRSRLRKAGVPEDQVMEILPSPGVSANKFPKNARKPREGDHPALTGQQNDLARAYREGEDMTLRSGSDESLRASLSRMRARMRDAGASEAEISEVIPKGVQGRPAGRGPQVMKLFNSGVSTNDIAEALSVTPGSVRSTMKRVKAAGFERAKAMQKRSAARDKIRTETGWTFTDEGGWAYDRATHAAAIAEDPKMGGFGFKDDGAAEAGMAAFGGVVGAVEDEENRARGAVGGALSGYAAARSGRVAGNRLLPKKKRAAPPEDYYAGRLDDAEDLLPPTERVKAVNDLLRQPDGTLAEWTNDPEMMRRFRAAGPSEAFGKAAGGEAPLPSEFGVPDEVILVLDREWDLFDDRWMRSRQQIKIKDRVADHAEFAAVASTYERIGRAIAAQDPAAVRAEMQDVLKGATEQEVSEQVNRVIAARGPAVIRAELEDILEDATDQEMDEVVAFISRFKADRTRASKDSAPILELPVKIGTSRVGSSPSQELPLKSQSGKR